MRSVSIGCLLRVLVCLEYICKSHAQNNIVHSKDAALHHLAMLACPIHPPEAVDHPDPFFHSCQHQSGRAQLSCLGQGGISGTSLNLNLSKFRCRGWYQDERISGVSYPEQAAREAEESRIAAQHARAKAILAAAEEEGSILSAEPSPSDSAASHAQQNGSSAVDDEQLQSPQPSPPDSAEVISRQTDPIAVYSRGDQNDLIQSPEPSPPESADAIAQQMDPVAAYRRSTPSSSSQSGDDGPQRQPASAPLEDYAANNDGWATSGLQDNAAQTEDPELDAGAESEATPSGLVSAAAGKEPEAHQGQTMRLAAVTPDAMPQQDEAKFQGFSAGQSVSGTHESADVREPQTKAPELDSASESLATPASQSTLSSNDLSHAEAEPLQNEESRPGRSDLLQAASAGQDELASPAAASLEAGSASESLATPTAQSSPSSNDLSHAETEPLQNEESRPSRSDLLQAASAGQDELASPAAASLEAPASEQEPASALDLQSSLAEQNLQPSASTPDLASDDFTASSSTAASATGPSANASEGQSTPGPVSFQTEDPELSSSQEEAQTPLARGAESQAWIDAEPTNPSSANGQSPHQADGESLNQADGNGVGHSGVEDPRTAISTAPELSSSAEDLSTPQAYRPEPSGEAAGMSSRQEFESIQDKVRT